jgi:preprotein translocase subunit SecF
MFDFVRKRKLFYLLSAVMIVPGVISLMLPGGLRPGIDFTSGTLMTVRFDNPVDQTQLREAFAQLGHGDAVVQRSGEDSFIIRTRPLTQSAQLQQGTGASEREIISNELQSRFGSLEILNLDQVSPLIAEEIVRNAIIAVVVASAFILFYLWWAFRGIPSAWRYGTTAVVALLHDALVVLGAFSILGRIFPLEIESTFIVAVLTVIGFSVHDTIVVFDRVRENSIRYQGVSFSTVVNHSLMQTVGRSLTTSLSVLLTLVVLLLFGGVTIRSFALALLIGIGAGTYSSIFVASMMLVSWQLGELRRLWPFGTREPAAVPA